MRIPMPPSMDASPSVFNGIEDTVDASTDKTDLENKRENASSTYVQIICKPDDGAVFKSPDFDKCWDDWVLPNVIKNYSASLIPSSARYLNVKKASTSDFTGERINDNTVPSLNDSASSSDEDVRNATVGKNGTEQSQVELKSPGKNFSVISLDEPIVWC
jgi:hypothetical protein